jgi:hypothetical protein
MEIVDSAESMLLVSFMWGNPFWMALLIVNAVKSLLRKVNFARYRILSEIQ